MNFDLKNTQIKVDRISVDTVDKMLKFVNRRSFFSVDKWEKCQPMSTQCQPKKRPIS
jgi:hypothetical protein